MSRIREVEIINDTQNPIPVNADSIYATDIDVANSDNGGFSGIVTDYFDSLKTVNNDASATNPKIIKIWFDRSYQTSSIGFGCDDLGKSFSNIKIKILGSGDVVRYTKDLSADNTKYNSLVIDFPPLVINGAIIEFHTTDEIGLSNIIIYKTRNVDAQLSAISDLTGESENVGSFRGALNINQALVHQEGISEYFKRDIGGATTLSVAISSGDTSITVANSAGFVIGDLLRLSSSSIRECGHFHIINVVGNVITLNRPVDNDFEIGDAVTEIDISMNEAGTLANPVVFRIQPPSFERWQITRFLVSMLDTTAMDNGTFGGMTALSNGIVLRVVRNGVVITGTYWTSNQDLKDDMYDVDYSSKAPAGQYGLSARWSLLKSEFVLDIDGATGDYIEALVQDDLTPLDDFKIKAQGRLFGG